MGCSTSGGYGAGKAISPDCSASGASYAGIGGPCTNITEGVSTCSNFFAEPYGQERDLLVGGSGGGSFYGKGGAGGGLIWVHALDRLSLNGQIYAKGGNAQDSFAEEELNGSGGGSGGGIQLHMAILEGNGSLSVSGGSGSWMNGGGGSGGRISLQYLKSLQPEFYPNMTINWSGKAFLDGGLADGNGFQGENGSQWATRCKGGYHGVYCRPCPIGKFKLDYSYQDCENCTNKPPNSYYTMRAWPNESCAY